MIYNGSDRARNGVIGEFGFVKMKVEVGCNCLGQFGHGCARGLVQTTGGFPAF